MNESTRRFFSSNYDVEFHKRGDGKLYYSSARREKEKEKEKDNDMDTTIATDTYSRFTYYRGIGFRLTSKGVWEFDSPSPFGEHWLQFIGTKGEQALVGSVQEGFALCTLAIDRALDKRPKYDVGGKRIKTGKVELSKWDACVRAYRLWLRRIEHSDGTATTSEDSAYIDTLLALPREWKSPTQVGCGA
jgi:hypothetical protein